MRAAAGGHAVARRTVVVAAGVLAAVIVAGGLWAMVDPQGFAAEIAPFPPYNEHLNHDIGAFLLGLGACLAFGLCTGDALLAVLAGNAVGAGAHFVSHVMDRDLGGHASDPFSTGALALVLVALTVLRWRTSVRPRATAGPR